MRRLDALGATPPGPRALPRHAGINTFRASRAQERLWSFEQLAPGSTVYNVVGAFDLVGPLDLAALQRSIDALVARHESFRTTFAAVEGVPMQVVSPAASVRLRCLALVRPDASQAAARATLYRNLNTPFDVARGPLLRITLVPVDADRHLVGVALHHLIGDAWSVGIICRELSVLYRAALAGGGSTLAPLMLQYADYAEWQRAAEGGAAERAALTYWREQLADASYPDVPVGTRRRFAGAARTVELAPALADAVRVRGRRERTTLFVITLTAWIRAIAERYQCDDVTVLAPVANREQPEVADVVGFFVNLVALRVRIDGGLRFRSLLDRARDVVRGALQHQGLSFERMLSELGIERTLARPPVTPFAFAVEREDVEALDFPGVTVTRLPIAVTTSKTDLALVVVEGTRGLSARLEYDRERYDATVVDGLLDGFVRALHRLAADPDAGLDVRDPDDPGDRRVEVMLAEIWEEVLGVSVRSVDANFFRLGGDSLSSIRVVARARRRGLVFTPQQLFEHQTIAALAPVVVERATPEYDQGPVVGPVEITPIQRILLEAELPELDHFNMATMLLADGRLEPSLVAIAVEHLIRQHDALRLRVRQEPDGWRQAIASLDGEVPFEFVEISAVADQDVASAIEERAAREQATLNLAVGPIVRVVLFDLGSGRRSRLLVIVHHLACDAVSWPILVDDLATLYDQLRRGEPIALPPKSASFQRWAERVGAWGRDSARTMDVQFWRDECADAGARLPRLRSDGAPRVADAAVIEHELDPTGTRAVLTALSERGTSVEATSLAALVTAVTEQAGGTDLLVYLERHGRDVLPDLDLSRTVGWFTAVFPFRLRVAPSGLPAETLAGVADRLRAIPHGGVGFAAVRHALGAWHRPEISVNYLGHDDAAATTGWGIAPESVGPETGGGGLRPTILDLTVRIASGKLRLTWQYDQALLARPVIERLAERCAAVMRTLASGTPTRSV